MAKTTLKRSGQGKPIEMNYRECIDRSDDIATFMERQTPPDCRELDAEHYSIYGLVAIRCLRTGKFSADRDGEHAIFDIPITRDGTDVGHLILLSQLDRFDANLSRATDSQKVAYIRLASTADFDQTTGFGKYDVDCVVIREESFQEFMGAADSSSLWGGFVLESRAIALRSSTQPASISSIEIKPLPPPPTSRHAAALQRAAESSIATDRFLHLYHFLELDYDHEIIRRIRALGHEETRGLEKILSTGKTELDRLTFLTEGFDETSEIEEACTVLKDHQQPAIDVFYEYGKETNPLKDRETFLKMFIDPGVINRTSLDQIRRMHRLSANFTKSEAAYKSTLVKLSCYWVYRIRCCIAHNRLGEYHLHTPSDMDFVSSFGERIIKSLISYRLRALAVAH